jgi:hypothetical protein
MLAHHLCAAGDGLQAILKQVDADVSFAIEQC